MEAPNKFTNQNSAINKATSTHEENHISKSKEENATSMIRGNHVIRIPSRRFCSALRHSYCLVSSTTTAPKIVDERTLQVKEKVIKPFINML
jgi:hypothetical protein